MKRSLCCLSCRFFRVILRYLFDQLEQIFAHRNWLENAAVGDCGESPVQLVRGNSDSTTTACSTIGPRPRCTLDWRDETRNFVSARVPHAQRGPRDAQRRVSRLASPSARRSALHGPHSARAPHTFERREAVSAASTLREKARGGVAGWHRARSAGSLARRTRRSLRTPGPTDSSPAPPARTSRRRPAAPSLEPTGPRIVVGSGARAFLLPILPITTSASPSVGALRRPPRPRRRHRRQHQRSRFRRRFGAALALGVSSLRKWKRGSAPSRRRRRASSSLASRGSWAASGWRAAPSFPRDSSPSAPRAWTSSTFTT